jgi:phage N-6-adenine-methyltransferase
MGVYLMGSIAPIAEAWADAIGRSTDLVALERIVEKGKSTFLEVGFALIRIHDAQLYKSTHSTWEKYCEQRWGWTRTRGYQLMQAARMSTTVDTPLANERQARALIHPVLEIDPTDGEVITPDHASTAAPSGVATVESPGAGKIPISQTEDYDGDEWRTPPEYIEKVRAVLGRIDLDPASTAAANKTVKAKRYFDKAHDGLAQEWSGQIFLNPPYSGELVRRFCSKLVTTLDSVLAAPAVALLNSDTSTQWFHLLANKAECLCFPKQRIAFLDASGKKVPGNRIAQVFFFFGVERPAVVANFKDIGTIVAKVR